MPASQHTIAGRVLTMPVKIRRADLHMAAFSVDADAAQRLIDYSGLQVYRYLRGRAVVELTLMRYMDGDLDQYHEFGICVMVNPPGSNASGLRAIQSAFIRHFSVDQAFTLEAGQRIWGFPKVMADFTIRDGDQFGFDVSIEGQLVVGMEFRQGLPVPFGSRPQTLRAYSHRDGMTRETPYETTMTGSRYRPGGVRLWLGDHPFAKELASLGLPKRALVSGSADNVEMSFADAQIVG
jgi:Acetoacetate decarboxylase (ADC)